MAIDAGDDTHRPAAMRASLDVNPADALEALCLVHRLTSLGLSAALMTANSATSSPC